MGKEENKVETTFDQQTKARGGFTRKYTSPGRKGVPDRIQFLDGCRFAELKTPKGELDILQQREHNRMRKQGVEVLVLSSVTEVLQYFNDWDEMMYEGDY